MKPINYGILGCGGHALESHAIPGSKVSSLRLLCVYDIKKENALALISRVPSAMLRTTEEGFWDSGLDAVVIATPDEHHFAQLQAAIAANMHVLVEKPIVTTTKQAEALAVVLARARTEGLVVTSCHPRRFDPPFVKLEKRLGYLTNKLGRVIHMDFDFSYHESTAQWKGQRSLLLDHFSHEIDLMHFLFGPAVLSASVIHNSNNRYEVVGNRPDDDLSFRFHGTRMLKKRHFREWLTLRHERGESLLDTSTGLLSWVNHENGSRGQAKVGATDYPKRFLGVMQNFADAMNHGRHHNYLSEGDLITNSFTTAMLLEQGRITDYHPY